MARVREGEGEWEGGVPVHQEGAEASSLGRPLRTTQVQVDGIHMRCHEGGCGCERFRRGRTELRDQGSVGAAAAGAAGAIGVGNVVKDCFPSIVCPFHRW